MDAVRVVNVVRSYRSPARVDQVVVDVPAFDVRQGEHVALVGASGSGKTTLLHLIAGVLTASSGSIFVAGQDVSAMREPQRDLWRARHVGYVFQTFNLLQAYTALENVELAMMFGSGVDRSFARELLEQVGLHDRLHFKPHMLSAGQQQRVAVARALANRPTVVLADEPTGNLDHMRAREAMSLMQRTCRERGAALLVVTHDRSLLDGFDRVVALGEINRANPLSEVTS